MNPGWLHMFRNESQFYKFLFWTVEQAAYTKYQYDPDTIIYNQLSKMQEAKQTQTTTWNLTTPPPQKKICKASLHEAICQDVVQFIKILKYHLTFIFILFYFIQFDWHRNMYFNKSVILRSQF
jgi:hypothetical protein